MKEWLTTIREQGRCLWLFMVLMGLLLLYPHLGKGTVGQLLLVVLYTATCLLAVWVSAQRRRQLIASIVTATPVVALSWVYFFVTGSLLLVAWWASLALFFLVTTATMFAYVAASKKVTRDTVFGGISVYLLLGLTWFAVYSVEEILEPGSFRGLSETGGATGSELLYFSFVTLTTVGYGDITPVTSHARSFAVLEAISGVLYVATFVARLVSLYRPESE